ncbi:MAG: hypothetical protein ABSB35_28135 [Bryobacteraceae bacterium]|jgi:hypothetical protein
MLKRRDKIAAAGASGVVLIVLAFAFFLSGSPQSQRLMSADERRLDDLSAIAMRLHAQARTPLPASLSELGPNAAFRLADPLTGAPYEYQRGQGTNYSICATFSLSSPADLGQRDSPFWEHPAGRHCYSLDSSQQPPLHVRDYRPY